MPIRFALIGCGKITERLALPQLKLCEDAEIAALVDIRREIARHWAGIYGVDKSRVWTDWRRMLREAEVDAVAVNVPNVLHAEIATGALQAKKHVIVEKPMAISLAEADTMIEAASRNGRYLMVEQTQRFDPMHEVAREVLRAGVLGELTYVSGEIGHAGPEYWSGTRQNWFIDKRQSGGGVLMDIGIHLADLLRWLSGKEIARVCCHAAHLKPDLEVEDSALALLEFKDGTLGSLRASWATQPYRFSTQIEGRHGMLRVEFGATHPVVVKLCKREGDPNYPLGEDFHPHIPPRSQVRGAYPYFVSCIVNKVSPSPSGQEGRAALEIILAAYESLRTGGWVDLPLAAGHFQRRAHSQSDQRLLRRRGGQQRGNNSRVGQEAKRRGRNSS